MYDTKLDIAGTGTASFEANTQTDLLTDIPAGMTVLVRGRGDSDGILRVDGTRTNNGTVILDSVDVTAAPRFTRPAVAARLVNNGTLRAMATFKGDRQLTIPYTNSATGTVTIDANARVVHQGDGGGTINAGTVTINGSEWFYYGANSYTQTGGALTINGSLDMGSGTLRPSGRNDAGPAGQPLQRLDVRSLGPGRGDLPRGRQRHARRRRQRRRHRDRGGQRRHLLPGDHDQRRSHDRRHR